MAKAAKASKNGDGVPPDAPVTWKGPDALRPLLVPIDRLHEDPGNVNTHPDRSIEAIAASYARFGQQRPVVVDASGIVRAGNGQLRAAAERLGWSHVAAVTSDLGGSDLVAFGVADNRTATFSHFDETALAETLRALQSEDFPLDAVGYDPGEVDALIEGLAAQAAGSLGDGDVDGSDQPGDAGSSSDVPPRPTLAERFGVPPFSVLDARQGYWQDRKRQWLSLGIQSELGRGGQAEDTYADREWIKAKGLIGLAQDAHVKTKG